MFILSWTFVLFSIAKLSEYSNWKNTADCVEKCFWSMHSRMSLKLNTQHLSLYAERN